MKPVYLYPELFLSKMGDLYWALGHPTPKTLPEESWMPLSKLARRRIHSADFDDNRPQLSLVSEFGDIDYIRTGKPGAPILLLIPGFPDTWYTFHKIIPLLARDYDVVTYSPPGHGYSSFTELFDFKIDTYCRVARMMMHRLELNNVHLIGHSCGGEQVIRTFLQTKGNSRIKSLTLINAWGASVFPRKTHWELSDDVTTWPIVGKELVRLFGGRLGGMQEMFRRVFYRPEERKHLQNLRQELSRPFLNGTAFRLFVNRDTARAISAMQSEQKRINESVEEYFRETRRQYGYLTGIPVLVVGTKHDRIFPYSYARGVFRSIQRHNPTTFFRKIKSSGHMPAIEMPQRLAYYLKQFIDRVESPGPITHAYPTDEEGADLEPDHESPPDSAHSSGEHLADQSLR